MIPETNRENCDACAAAGGRFYSTCRRCLARHVARMPPLLKREFLDRAHLVHTSAFVDEFEHEVRTYWAKNPTEKKP